MKAVLFHGYRGSPNALWFPSVSTALDSRGYTVLTPWLPNPQLPRLNEWLPFAVQNVEYTEDTILIGHSSGGALILALLEQLEAPIRQSILVASFYEPLRDDTHYPILKSAYDWEKIRSNCKEFVFIHSDNDPWGAGEQIGRSLLEKLGGTLVVAKDQGHFGSNTFDEPYPDFPLLVRLVAER